MVTGLESTDVVAEVMFEADCMYECLDSVVGDGAATDGAAQVDDARPIALASGACPTFKASSLAEVLPCQATDTCCSTAVQYDPCASGAKVTTAPSRWHMFRFWTANSPACVAGKPHRFLLQPIEPAFELSVVDTITWAPRCEGETSATTWATIRIPGNGSGPAASDVNLLSLPFDDNFSPCGATRIGPARLLALGCKPWPEIFSPESAPHWAGHGTGFCCGPENVLVDITSGTVSNPLTLPPGFDRWGIPKSIPSTAPRSQGPTDVMVPVFKGKHQDWDYDDGWAPDGWVENLKVARIGTQAPSLAVKAIMGNSHADYSMGRRQVAVLDANHMAWTYDARAPQPRFGYWDGTEYAPALAMLVGGGTKETALFEPMFDVNGWYSKAIAVGDSYLVVTDNLIIEVDKLGTVASVNSVKFQDPEEGGHEYDAIGAPDGGIFASTVHLKADVSFMTQVRRVLRLDAKGKEIWSWTMNEARAWVEVTNLSYQDGILHVFGILVPKTNDSTWAWHLRLDAATGKELCPGQMPGKP